MNKGRAEAKTRLMQGDVLRIPPIRISEKQLVNQMDSSTALKNASKLQVLYEDDGMFAVLKPSGIAVHGGSGQSAGVIECLRLSRPEHASHLELVHRIDRETSGVLLVSKKRSYLRALQEQLRNRVWKKHYLALVVGQWPSGLNSVDLSLRKTQAGPSEKKVFVCPDGDKAKSLFRVEERFSSSFGDFSLLNVQILTGRTHQIRVHTSASGYPIAGDDRYGDFALNKILVKRGLARMFLHARSVTIEHPVSGDKLTIEAPLTEDLTRFINQF